MHRDATASEGKIVTAHEISNNNGNLCREWNREIFYQLCI